MSTVEDKLDNLAAEIADLKQILLEVKESVKPKFKSAAEIEEAKLNP